MKITGYRPLTEKERDYLMIHRLLRKYEIPISSIDEFLNNRLLNKKGGLPLDLVSLHLSRLMPFRIACHDSPTHTIILNELPEGTTELFIEIK